MILAVDIGNSNIVLGCFENEQILFTERLSTNQNSTELEYTILIKNILELNNLNHRTFEGCIISSVVPSVTHTMEAAMRRLTGKAVMVVGPGIRTGLKIMLDNPAQLGSDRVADAVAAIHDYPTPLIIIDMGTATTISAIDRNKNFLGGMIIPGLRVSLDSLTSRTSQLPKIGLDPPKKVIGSLNTVDCMRSGIIYSTAGSMTVSMTGSRAKWARPVPSSRPEALPKSSSHTAIIRLSLMTSGLLKGLMVIYNKNRAAS